MLLNKLIAAQITKRLSGFLETKGSLPRPREGAAGPCTSPLHMLTPWFFKIPVTIIPIVSYTPKSLMNFSAVNYNSLLGRR
jgi:hypothetical protein